MTPETAGIPSLALVLIPLQGSKAAALPVLRLEILGIVLKPFVPLHLLTLGGNLLALDLTELPEPGPQFLVYIALWILIKLVARFQ